MVPRWLRFALVAGLVGCADGNGVAPRTRTLIVTADRFRSPVTIEQRVPLVEPTVGTCTGELESDGGVDASCRRSAGSADYRLTVTGPVEPMRLSLRASRDGLPVEVIANTDDLTDVTFSWNSSSNESLTFIEAHYEFEPTIPLEVVVSPARPVFLNGAALSDGVGLITAQAFDVNGALASNIVSLQVAPTERCATELSPELFPAAVASTRAGVYSLDLASPLRTYDSATRRSVLPERLTIEVTCSLADGGTSDAGVIDAGISDAGPLDAGPGDAGATDGGAPDAGSADAGRFDAGTQTRDAGERTASPGVTCLPSQFTCAPNRNGAVVHTRPNTQVIGTYFPEGDTTSAVLLVEGRALTYTLDTATGVLRAWASGSEIWSRTPLLGHAGALAVCDTNLDGIDDVLVATRDGFSSQISGVSSLGVEGLAFSAGLGSTSAVSIACGHFRGNLVPDLIVGAGPGGVGSVQVMTVQGALISSFQPYGASFSGGLTVAVGRFLADHASIIVAPRQAMASEVKIFHSLSAPLASVTAFSSSYLGGASVAVADFELDGVDELLVAQLAGPSVERYRFASNALSLQHTFTPLGPSYSGPLFISATPPVASGCTVVVDAGVLDAGVDAGTSTRDAGAGCTAPEGAVLAVAVPAQSGRVFTRIRSFDGRTFVLAAGNLVAGAYELMPDAGVLRFLSGSIIEPTGAVAVDGTLYFSDKGHVGMNDGWVVGVPLDGGLSLTGIGFSEAFPYDLALVRGDAGASLVWPNASTGELRAAPLPAGPASTVITGALSMQAFTTDDRFAYVGGLGSAVYRLALDGTGQLTLNSSAIRAIGDVVALAVQGDQLYVMGTSGLSFNPRTTIIRVKTDGTATPITVVDVAGRGTAMHLDSTHLYVSESGAALGCSTYRVWRTPLNSVNATSVQPVLNSARPILDFELQPGRVVFLGDAVYSAPF